MRNPQESGYRVHTTAYVAVMIRKLSALIPFLFSIGDRLVNRFLP